MIYTELTKRAMRIAYDAHKEQTDKSGLPYIFHPVHLAEQMDTEEEVCVALLHDVAEDTAITQDELRSRGFTDKILGALALLTHVDSDGYFDYITRMKFNPIAVKVKLADLRHNSDLSRFDTPDGVALKRAEVYKEAMKILQNTRDSFYCSNPEFSVTKAPLDDERVFFLSKTTDKRGNVHKYSIDVEKANDSHYSVVASEMQKLIGYFGGGNLETALREFLKQHDERGLTQLLDKLEVKYSQFHY